MLGAHLRAGEPQARPAGAVGQQRVERQGAGVGGAQAGLGDQHDEGPVGRAQACEVVLVLELAHHVLGDEAGQAVAPAGQQLVVVDHRLARNSRGSSRGGGCPAAGCAGASGPAPWWSPRARAAPARPGTVRAAPRSICSGWSTGGSCSARKWEKCWIANASTRIVLNAQPVASRCRAQRLVASRSHGGSIPAKLTAATATGRGNTQVCGLPGVGGVAAFQVLTVRLDQPQRLARCGLGPGLGVPGPHEGSAFAQAPHRFSSARRSSTSRWR